MAKNVRIVPASGSIYFTADGYDVTGSIRLQLVDNTEDLQLVDGNTDESILIIHKDAKRVAIGLTSGSAKLEVASSVNEEPFRVSTPNGSIKVTGDGILQLTEYQGTVAPISGGLIFSSSQLFVGI
jgi:ferric-dicitrate binding protein FerR (iron transport regulator)